MLRAMDNRLFRWACFAVGVAAVAILLWMIDDLRREAKRTNAIIDAQLPRILDNAKTATDTVAKLAKDIEAMRDLAGLSAPADRSLALYADALLDYLEAQPGQIGLDKKLGSGMKDLLPVADWVRDARREALWLTFRASTKADLLDRLAKNKFGSPWYYVPPSGEPVPLAELLARAKTP